MCRGEREESRDVRVGEIGGVLREDGLVFGAAEVGVA